MESQQASQETSIQAESQQEQAQGSSAESISSAEGLKAAADRVLNDGGEAALEKGQVKAPAYTPSFKFKVANQEKEMDEFVRAAITDADTEKKIRELYEKAYGLDIVKPRMNEYREKARALETEYAGLREEVDQVLSLREKDLGSFFQAIQIPKEKVFQWVSDQLNYENLPPEERQRLDRERSVAERADLLEQKYQEIEHFAQAQATHARTVELKMSLNSPEIRTFVDRFDAQAGQPGAFESEVIRMGKQIYLESGQDISADQAVKLVMDHYGRFLGSVPAAPTQAAQHTQNPQATQAAVKSGKPPVIPAVNARSTSFADRQVTSIDDLKNIYNEKYGPANI